MIMSPTRKVTKQINNDKAVHVLSLAPGTRGIRYN